MKNKYDEDFDQAAAYTLLYNGPQFISLNSAQKDIAVSFLPIEKRQYFGTYAGSYEAKVGARNATFSALARDKAYLAFREKIKDILDQEVFSEEWTTGGIGGGNCWSAGGHYSISGDPEPEITIIDEILEVVCPEISMIKYKKIINGLMIKTNYTEAEYYGNSTDHAIKYFFLSDLYEILSDAGLLNDL